MPPKPRQKRKIQPTQQFSPGHTIRKTLAARRRSRNQQTPTKVQMSPDVMVTQEDRRTDSPQPDFSGYKIPRKRKVTSPDSSPDVTPQKKPKYGHEEYPVPPVVQAELLQAMDQLRDKMINEIQKVQQGKSQSVQKDRRWLLGIENTIWKWDAVQQQVRYNDGCFLLVQEARNAMERGGAADHTNVQKLLEKVEQKINKRQKYLWTANKHGFAVADLSFGSSEDQLSAEDAKTVRDAQMLVAKRDKVGLSGRGGKKKEKSYTDTDEAQNKGGDNKWRGARKNILCFCCGEKDHIARDCPKKDSKQTDKAA